MTADDSSDRDSLYQINGLTRLQPHSNNNHSNVNKSKNFNNPFVYKGSLSWMQYIKLAIMTVTIFPIRLFLVALSLFMTCLIGTIACAKHDTNKPMTGWRKHIALPIFLVVARSVFFFAGFHWVSTRGKICSREEAPILALAPHSSFLDALIVVFLGMRSVLGKTETANSILGSLLKMTQPILVSREVRQSRQKAQQEIRARCLNKKWQQLIIFPEGTCTNRSALISYKLGAFNPGLPVQPIILKWENQCDGVTWTWEGPSIYYLVWLNLCQFHNYVYLEYLPVYYPNEEEKNNPSLYASNVRDLMAKALNLPVTDYAYDDCRMMVIAKQCNLEMAEIIVEFSRLSRDLMQENDRPVHNLYQNLVDQCKAVGANEITKICIDEFAAYLNQPVSSMLKKVFDFYDKNDNGYIDFREFVVGLSLICSPEDTDETLKIAYQLYSGSLDSAISKEDLSNLLVNAFLLDYESVVRLLSAFYKNEATNEEPRIGLSTFLYVCRSHDAFARYREFKDTMLKVTTASKSQRTKKCA